MATTNPPTPRQRNSGCWLIAFASISIAAILTLIALFLPPINLPDRLLSLQYSPLNRDNPTLSFESELQLSLPTTETTADFALKISRLSATQFDSNTNQEPAWLPIARSKIPHHLKQQSPLYLLESRGEAPAQLQIELLTPAAPPEPRSLYGWDGTRWTFIPTDNSNGNLAGSANFLPLGIAAFEIIPAAPIILVSQEITQDLDQSIANLATILSPAGLRPTLQGSLVGSLAPGGNTNSAYLFMPLIRNFADPRAIDTTTIETLIANPSLRAEHISQITNIATFNDFAGVFIDYRGLPPAQRQNFSHFIDQLAQSLSEQGLLLGVVLPTQRDENESGAYDWRSIGAAADFFQLQASINPLDFLPNSAGGIDDLLRQATRTVDRSKILLGLSARSVREVNGILTSINWHDAFAALGDVTLYAEQASQTDTIEPGTVIRAALTGYQLRLGLDNVLQTSYLDYLDDTGETISRIWLTDAAALHHRLQLTLPHAIAGIAFDDLLATGRADGISQTILNFKAQQPSAPAPNQLSARWSIDGQGGPLDQVTTNLNDELILTLEAPDGNYAVNWSLMGTDGVLSQRGGAVLPLFQPTATPTPTPTPTPRPAPTARPVVVVTEPDLPTYGGAAPPAGSISIEIGGHVTSASSGRAVGAMRTAGMTWMKIQARYDRGSPPNVGNEISAAHNNGFKILVGTVGSPDQLAAGGQDYINAYTDWLAQIAGQGADAIEVWNEPNLDREWPRGKISGAAYAQMLKTAWEKIKRVNSAVMVISAAPAPTGVADIPDQVMPDNRWLRQMVEAGGLNYLDCVGVHYNEGIIPPSQTTGDPRGDNYYTRYFHGMLTGYVSITRRPLCFTELGYLTSEGLPGLPPYFSWANNVTLQQQATWLAQAAALASQSGQVRLFIVWNIDFTHYGADPQAGFAIVRPDGSCPACAALAAAR